jgi:hypothetical protein
MLDGITGDDGHLRGNVQEFEHRASGLPIAARGDGPRHIKLA